MESHLVRGERSQGLLQDIGLSAAVRGEGPKRSLVNLVTNQGPLKEGGLGRIQREKRDQEPLGAEVALGPGPSPSLPAPSPLFCLGASPSALCASSPILLFTHSSGCFMIWVHHEPL